MIFCKYSLSQKEHFVIILSILVCQEFFFLNHESVLHYVKYFFHLLRWLYNFFLNLLTGKKYIVIICVCGYVPGFHLLIFSLILKIHVKRLACPFALECRFLECLLMALVFGNRVQTSLSHWSSEAAENTTLHFQKLLLSYIAFCPEKINIWQFLWEYSTNIGPIAVCFLCLRPGPSSPRGLAFQLISLSSKPTELTKALRPPEHLHGDASPEFQLLVRG